MTDGTCCVCGYEGDEETACPGIGMGGTHCDHWWDGKGEEQP